VEGTAYTKAVCRWKVNLYTVVQLVLVAVLWAVKLTPAAMSYPLLVVLIIPLHKFLKKYIYTKNEIRMLDGEDAHDDDHDEYDNLHVPY
jgi:solute carrier family 4 anion exchanger 2/solute carrier family 4 anion exchanger 3